jgi:hypothetical protein
VFTAEICTSVVAILHPGWEPQTYQIFLINVACALIGLVLNIWLFNCESPNSYRPAQKAAYCQWGPFRAEEPLLTDNISIG